MATRVCGNPALRRLLRGPCVARSGARGYAKDHEGSWFRSLFVHKVDPRKDAHSTLLSKKETSNLYKIQFHNVKPECLDAYNSLTEEVLPKLHSDPDYPCDLVGNWNTWYGEQDQAVHLWRFSGGYPALMDCMNKLKRNQEYLAFRQERSKMLLSRRNQLLLEFSFWNEPLPRAGPNVYELRTYKLKPGTMIEWGNNWARAIKHRQENEEAVGGFFSQIGELYVVHHLWAYRDLHSREETRNAAWRKRGWDENVYYTAPIPRPCRCHGLDLAAAACYGAGKAPWLREVRGGGPETEEGLSPRLEAGRLHPGATVALHTRDATSPDGRGAAEAGLWPETPQPRPPGSQDFRGPVPIGSERVPVFLRLSDRGQFLVGAVDPTDA